IFPYRGVAIETNSLLAPWQRFDANWYLKIAQRGYSADDGSTVYFPLYPLLIRIFGGGLLAAIVISNLALIGVFYLVYQLGKDLMGEKFAARALAYLAIFPTAFFLFAPYTESLFLFFSLASIHAAAKEKFPRASIFAALAALTRLQGALLIFPLAYLVWKKNNAARLTLDASRSFSYTFRNTFFLALIPLATVSFLLYQYFFVGKANLVAAYERQLFARFVMPWENLAASITLIANGAGEIADILNLIVTILFGIMLIPLWRKMPREYFLFAALMFFAPLFRMTTTQPLVSMSRYVLVMFPVFLLWAKWGARAWVNRAMVYASFALQLFFSAQFFLWGW
ncbi:MAG: glycosyltransferase family 39 protein, partial [Chloroflexi bacterium]|nr:glycosyltransferase family 39 protein [Chloroflexota bacterium]